MLMKILPAAKKLMEEAVSPGDTVVDATCGNGHDTKFLSELTGPAGKVYSFDIQKAAIDNARELTNGCGNIEFIHDSHARAEKYIETSIQAVMFNLGYLPRGDKSITTEGESTIEAISQLFELLKPGGRIVIVVYHGHEKGKEERDALYRYLSGFPQEAADILEYRFINQRNNAPFILCVEKAHKA